MVLNVKVVAASAVLFVSLLLFGCSQELTDTDFRNDGAPSPSVATLPASPTASVYAQHTPPASASLSYTPFPDDSEQRKLLDNLPDYWGDWIPEDDTVYIQGVKDFGRVMFVIRRSIEDMKQYYEQMLENSQWGGGAWEAREDGYFYTLSKHNPRMKLEISIINAEGTSRIDVFQEYREQDGY